MCVDLLVASELCLPCTRSCLTSAGNVLLIHVKISSLYSQRNYF